MPQSKQQISAKSKGRSRLSNGHLLPRSIDSRSTYARRLRDVRSDLLADYPDASQAELAIIDAAAVQKVELEILRDTFAARGHAEPSELELHQRVSNSMRRHLQVIGLSRRSRDVTPDLDSYLRQRARAREQAEQVDDAEVINGSVS